jgi:ABC-2 type transport system ATP-binding protein
VDFAIETRGLRKVYGERPAVDGLDLAVPRGSFYGFLGPNGAGKSTTIKVLTGIIAPTAGDARILGLPLNRRSLDIKRRTGVVPEDLCLFDNLTALEYLVFVGRMYDMSGATARSRAAELLTLMELDTAGRKLTAEFSHGMKKKLSLAGALIHDPELLFLDEPFEGIDAVSARVIRKVLARVVERGATIFLTSHILEIVEKLCTHVGIIIHGKVAKQGTLQELAAGNSLEQAFLEAVGHDEDAHATLSWLENRQP